MANSANLNIIAKALEKISNKVARDFGEIENMQSNIFAATKFANSCYLSIKEKIANDLKSIRPKYNIKFLDGEEIINSQNGKFCYIVAPVEGLVNLSRSLPNFSSFIALQENIDGKEIITEFVLQDIIHNEIYSASKGGGSFLNNRRIRVLQHKPLNNIMCCLGSQKLLQHQFIEKQNFQLIFDSCPALNIARLAAGKIDLVILDKSQKTLLNIMSLLINESSLSVKEQDDLILIANPKLLN